MAPGDRHLRCPTKEKQPRWNEWTCFATIYIIDYRAAGLFKLLAPKEASADPSGAVLLITRQSIHL